MSDREVMQQALDALENLGKHTSERKCDEAITALRAALEQQDEPVVEPEETYKAVPMKTVRTGVVTWDKQAEPVAVRTPGQTRTQAFVLAEREACAQLCDRFANRMMSAEECADAIRARGQQAEPVDKALTNAEPQVDKEQAESGLDAVLAEREACAQLCEEVGRHHDSQRADLAFDLAQAIRWRRVLRHPQQAEPVWELGVAGRLSAEASALAGCERRSEPEANHATQNCSNDTANDGGA